MANGKFLIGKPSGGVTTVTVTDGATNTNLILPESGTVSGVTTAVTDNAIARYDGTTGKLQNSGVIVDDNGNLGVGSFPFAKLSTLAVNNSIAETVFMAGIVGVTNGFTVLKDSAANPNYIFHTTSGVAGLEIDGPGNVLLKAGTGALGYGTGAGGSVTQLTSKSTPVTLNKPTGRITMSNSALPAGASANFILNSSLITSTDLVYCQALTSASVYRVEVYSVSSGACSISVKNESAVSLSDSLLLVFCIIKGATA